MWRKLKRVAALSKNLDMLEFANNPYTMNEDNYPIKTKKANEGAIEGRRRLSRFQTSKAHENTENKGAELSENKGESGSIEPSNTKEIDDLAIKTMRC